ncbi:MAG: TonB-dependent receptor [Alphaproteobacteria bacterium]|nr:TonB-dependent receptor [Alphaproteobacteria bacterium]
MTARVRTGRGVLLCGVAAAACLLEAGAAMATDEIVVTARRRAETLQSVPIAVSSFEEERLNDLQASSIDGLSAFVPNLNLVQGRGSASSANIFIRGIGQPDALATFDPGAGVYVDDVYISRIRGALFDIVDLERMEVLRGPQGTLYGKNSIAGAIKLISRKPDDTFRLATDVTVGEYERVDLRGSVSGPLVTEKLAAGLTLFTANRNGFVTDPLTGDEYNDKETVGGRLLLRATPSPDLEILFSVDGTEEHPSITIGRAEDRLTTFGGGFTLRPAPTGEYDFTAASTVERKSQDLEHYGTGLTASWTATDSLTAKSITAYRNLHYNDYVDIDATELVLGDVFVGVDQYQFSQEVQALYDAGGRFTGVAGLFYLHESIKSDQIAFGDDLFGVTFTRDVNDDLDLNSYAAFGQGSYQLTDRLSLSAGLRFTWEEKTYRRFTTTNFGGTFAFQDAEGWGAWTPSASIDYDWTPDFMTYASISRGFKSGGFNGRANSPGEEEAYEPEFVWTYEVGAKSQWADGRLRANFAAFYNDYTDFQARVAGMDIGDFPVLNAGQLVSYGAELELTAQPIEALTLAANLGYLNAEYEEFIDGTVDRSDDVVPFSPDWTLGLLASYRIGLGNAGDLTLTGTGTFKSDHYLSVDNDELLTQDNFWVVNALATWVSPEGHYSLSAGVKNLFDELYKTDAQEFSNVGNIKTAYYGDPRTLNLTFRVRY